jgi:hypothetical protein
MIVNMVTTLVEGIPVYPGMTWDSFGGCVLPFCVAIFSIVLFYGLFVISKFKDRKLN